MATMNSATLPTNFGKNAMTTTYGASGGGNIATDTISEATSGSGVTISSAATCSSTLAVTGATTLSSTLAVTGATTFTGGTVLPSTTTVFHSGGVAPTTTTTGTELVAATTESYVVEMFIPNNCTITGIALLNATAVAGNIQISLADTTGAIITAAQTASTAASGTAAYQQVPFAVAYAAKAGRYFVVLQCNNTGMKFRTHVLGNFTAGKLTGGTYGTFTTVASLIGTFTTGLGPICDTY